MMLHTATLALLLTLPSSSFATAGLCGGAPCLVLGPCAPSSDWTWQSQQIDGQTASNIVNAAQTKLGKDIDINCPGTTTDTSGSGP